MAFTDAVFHLWDIPADWEIRLSQEFTDALDRLNRPFLYEPGKMRRSAYWESGELHKRTLNKRSLEVVAAYKRRHAFFERLWGRHRFKEYHFKIGDPRRKVDTGGWITKRDIEFIQEALQTDEANLEKHIIGMRKGKASNYNIRELAFPGLPIYPNDDWAWLLGYYFSSGTIFLRKRYKPYYDGIHFRMRVHELVFPKLLELCSRIGSNSTNYDHLSRYRRAESKRKIIRKTKGLHTKKLPEISLSWSEYLVLSKMGLPTDFEMREADGSGSRSYKPRIPDWVKENDQFMRSFIEGFLNAPRANSMLYPTPAGHKRPSFRILLRLHGSPEDYIKNFLIDIGKWFNTKGIKGSFRKLDYYSDLHPNKVEYELGFFRKEAFHFFIDNFEIYSPLLRARLLLRTEADYDIVIYEILRTIKGGDCAVLGSVYEESKTAEDLTICLPMNRESVIQSLKSLQKRGILIKDGNLYSYDPSIFIKRKVRVNRLLAEYFAKKIERYSGRLLYRCPECGQIYIRPREECGICHVKVDPILRNSILAHLNQKRSYSIRIAKKLLEMEKKK